MSVEKTDYRGMYAAQLDDLGSEILDPSTLYDEIDIMQAESTEERIRRILRSEMLARAADAAGFDTEEESNDFDISDDDENLIPMTQYEAHFQASQAQFVEEVLDPTIESENGSPADSGRNSPPSPDGGEADPEEAKPTKDSE